MRNWTPLLRYNLTVVISQSVWLIIVPVAATQLLMLWFMAMAALYKPWTPVQVVELLAPVLAAFLAAHALGSEYRYRAEEVLLCKPTGITRLLWQRLLVLYGFLAVLIALVLVVFHFGIQTGSTQPEVPARLLLVAGLPSTLFLSMLALALATLFRNPMLGWLLAGLYWALDLVGGVRFHPLLTLQAYTAAAQQIPMGEFWHWSKALLLALALLFCLLNGRWLRSPEGLRRREQRRKAYLALGLALVLYLYTGAWSKIRYGVGHEAQLGRRARTWYQDMFQSYRGLPMARAFGRDFAAYIYKPRLRSGESEEQTSKAREAEMASLARVAERHPRSRWADNALFALAQNLRGQDEPGEALTTYQKIIEEYPDSVFAPMALQEAGEVLEEGGAQEQAFDARKQLLQLYPGSWETWPAAAFYARWSWERGQAEEAAGLLQRVAEEAPTVLRGLAYIARAELLWGLGETQAAGAAAERAIPFLREAEKVTASMANREVDPILTLLRQPVQAALPIADALKKGQAPDGSLTGILRPGATP